MNSVETLSNLQKFLALLNPAINMQEMLGQVAQLLVEMFEVEHSGFLQFGHDDLEGTVWAEYPLQGAIGFKVPLTDYPLVEKLKETLKPIPVFDAQNDPIMGNAQAAMRALGIQSILIIPLAVRGTLVGSLSLDATKGKRHFGETELELCHLIGRQIAVAVDYANALAQAEANERQAKTLRRINRLIGQTLNLDKILALILEHLEKVIPADGSTVYLLTEGKGIEMKAWRAKNNLFEAQSFIPLDNMLRAASFINSQKAISVPDMHRHPTWVLPKECLIRAWLGVPLFFRKQAIGLLNLYSYMPEQFNADHIEIAQAIGNQAVLAIRNAQLYAKAKKRAELLSTVQEVGMGIISSLDLQKVLQAITTNVLTLVGASYVQLYLYEQKNNVFRLVSTPDESKQMQLKIAHPRKDGLTATVARSGEYMAIPDIFEHPFYQYGAQFQGFRAIIGLPLKKQDTVLGILNVFYSQPHYFSKDEIDLLKLLAIQGAVSLENARLYDLEVKQIEQELNIARQIQQGFFPQSIPQIAGWEIAAICLPARETGGDFYEFVKRSDDSLGVVVGDVSGKSIQAAMLMAASQSMARAKGSDHRSPAKVLTETNQLLYDDVPKGAFVAISYFLIEPNKNSLILSSGGQLAPFLITADNQPIELIEPPGIHLPAGVVLDISYDELAISLSPGDTLVFHTDGLVECQNQAEEMFGFERVTALLETLRGQTPDAILKTLLDAMNKFVGEARAHDDVTLVIVRYQGAEEPPQLS